MFEKNGEVEVYKKGKEVSPKVANEAPERYTVDDLVKDADVEKFVETVRESAKDPEFSIKVSNSEEE